MDQATLANMEKEAAALKAKHDAIQAVVALYRDEMKPSTATPAAATAAAHSSSRPPSHGGSKPRPQANNVEIVRRVAKDAISASSMTPVPTRQIMEALEREGVRIAGEKPQNAVSSILSRADEFTSNGRSGWTLARVDERYGGHAADENEASPAEPEEASDAEEVGASSIENRPGLSLVG